MAAVSAGVVGKTSDFLTWLYVGTCWDFFLDLNTSGTSVCAAQLWSRLFPAPGPKKEARGCVVWCTKVADKFQKASPLWSWNSANGI